MNRTSFGNFEQPELLGFIQVAGQFDFTLDAVHKPFLRFTVPAILGVNSEVSKPDCNALQIHSLSLCVQPQGH
jgi:hypothetical protein